MQIGKDIERYDWYYDPELFTEVIIDRLKSEQYRNSTKICELLNQQDQRIIELEEQLKNCIRPKFEIGQEVWFVNEISEEIYLGIVVGFEVSKVYFCPLDIYYRIEYEYGCLLTDDFEDKFVFATKEEAQAKLEELQGE